MRVNLESRLAALEAKSDALGAILVVGPYCEGEDPEPHERAAREAWEERFNSPPPADVKVLHICLRGLEPTNRDDDA